MKPYLMFGLRMAILTYGLTIAKEHNWLYFFLALYGFISVLALIDEIAKKNFQKQVKQIDDEDASA